MHNCVIKIKKERQDIMKTNANLRKRFLSIILSIAMVVSFFNVMDVSTYAAEEKNEDSFHATGNLIISDEDIANDKNAMSQEEFEAQFDDEITAAGALPSAVDNSTSKYFPAVGNQLGIGSCGCWADVYYAYTYARSRAKDVSATGDNVMSPAFVYNQIKCTGKGGTYLSDVLGMLKMEGAPAFSRADFETYSNENGCKTWFPSESLWNEAASNRITSYTYLDQPGTITSCDDPDLNEIKGYLKDGNILTYSCDIYGWNYKTLSAASGTTHAGEYIAVSGQYGDSWHRMTLVGYDDNVCFDINGDGTIQPAERGAFKIANSWGTSYKNRGFCWVSYDALNSVSQAGATTTNTRRQAMTQFVVQYVDSNKNYSSDVKMVMTLNTAVRKNARVIIKAVKNSDEYTHNFAATYLNNVLSYSLDGSTTANDGTVSYDLSNVVSDITPATAADYDWYVTIKDTNADSNAFALKNAKVKANGNTIAAFESNSASVDGSEATYLLEPTSGNVTTVYYQNNSWSNANIHYRVDNGSWTSVPGVKMAASDRTGYTWKYTIPLRKQNGVTVCFNDGNNNWDSNNGNNYHLGLGQYGIKNGNVTELGMSASVSIAGQAGNVYADVTVENGVAPYTFEYSYTRDGGDLRTGTSTKSHIYMSCYTKGLYEFNVKVTDATGNVCNAKGTYDFPGPYIEITPDKAGPQKVGTTVKFAGEYYNFYYEKFAPYFYWEISKDGKIYDGTVRGKSIEFTPDEAGVYTIKYYTLNYMGENFEKVITYEFVDSNIATVYYHNSSWSDAYVHYRVDNGSWTNAPGVKMQASDIEGYEWKFDIDLNTQNGVTVCFNNGNGSWDSNNGNNYYIAKGKYGVSNGEVKEISDNNKFSVKASVDRAVGGKYNKTNITATVKNGTAVKYNYYIYNYGQNRSVGYGNTNITYSTYGFTPYTAATYTIEVEAIDAAGNVATDKIEKYVVEGEKCESFTADVASPQATGKAINLTAKFVNYQIDPWNSFGITVSDGTTTSYITTTENNGVVTGTWTPDHEGTYTLTAKYTSFSGAQITKTMEYVISNGNKAVVYYNNSAWSSANIHYKVDNGSWTSVPGVQMQSSDSPKYTWMYTIDLNDAEGATICFNNGEGQWDSQNGQNYRVGKGQYAVIYGKVYHLG